MDCKSQMCMLCFKILSIKINVNPDETDSLLKMEMLQTIYPQMRALTSDNLNICFYCEKILQTSFNFKSCCLDIDDYLRNFLNSENKIDMDKVLRNMDGQRLDESSSDTKRKICRLCLGTIKDHTFRNDDDSYVKVMLEICLPELDLSLAEKSVICGKCLRLLDTQCHLIRNLSDMEGTVSFRKNQISNNVLGDSKNGNNCDETKDLNEATLKDMTKNNTESNNMETESNNSSIEKTMNSEEKGKVHSAFGAGKEEDNDATTNKCSECEYTSKENYCLELHVLLTHSDVKSMISDKVLNGVKTYICNECAFESIRDYTMWSHVLTHKDRTPDKMLKCRCCTFSCKKKNTLKKHQKKHAGLKAAQVSDLPRHSTKGRPLYHCSLCSFKNYKNQRTHFFRHVESNATILNCQVCTHKTNSKKWLKLHLHAHKMMEEPSALNFLKCMFCQFETLDDVEFSSHCKKCVEMTSSKKFYKVVYVLEDKTCLPSK